MNKKPQLKLRGLKRPSVPPTPLARSTPARRSALMAKAFNEWMRRFTQEPHRFATEFKTTGQFLRDRNEGRDPSYGEQQAAYLDELMRELTD